MIFLFDIKVHHMRPFTNSVLLFYQFLPPKSFILPHFGQSPLPPKWVCPICPPLDKWGCNLYEQNLKGRQNEDFDQFFLRFFIIRCQVPVVYGTTTLIIYDLNRNRIRSSIHCAFIFRACEPWCEITCHYATYIYTNFNEGRIKRHVMWAWTVVFAFVMLLR